MKSEEELKMPSNISHSHHSFLMILIISFKYIYSALNKYWNSKNELFCWLCSQDIEIKIEIEIKLQNVTFYYWGIQHIDALPAKFSTFRVRPPL